MAKSSTETYRTNAKSRAKHVKDNGKGGKYAHSNEYKKKHYRERKRLGLDGGWQDQIISAYGGIRKISINKSGKFFVKEIVVKPKIIKKLEKNFVLVFTKKTRHSSKLIQVQRKKVNKKHIIKVYDQIKNFVNDMETSLKKGDYKKIGEILKIIND